MIPIPDPLLPIMDSDEGPWHILILCTPSVPLLDKTPAQLCLSGRFFFIKKHGCFSVRTSPMVLYQTRQFFKSPSARIADLQISKP